MLLALAGWATGYDGSFPFDKPGDSYGEQKYVGMRIVCIMWIFVSKILWHSLSSHLKVIVYSGRLQIYNS